jgi:hypothetical protein
MSSSPLNSTTTKLFSISYMIQVFFPKSDHSATQNIKDLLTNKMKKNTKCT